MWDGRHRFLSFSSGIPPCAFLFYVLKLEIFTGTEEIIGDK